MSLQPYDLVQYIGPGGNVQGVTIAQLAASGFSAYSGWSGASAYSGISGYSGVTGASGVSGFSGRSGWSGFSAWSGTSGYSAYSGMSGYSSWSGFSGAQGTSGWSGLSAYSGISGYSGQSGWSGVSGAGASGFSGISGWSGKSGWSGTSGTSGASGTANGRTDGISLVFKFDSGTSTTPAAGYFQFGSPFANLTDGVMTFTTIYINATDYNGTDIPGNFWGGSMRTGDGIKISSMDGTKFFIGVLGAPSYSGSVISVSVANNGGTSNMFNNGELCVISIIRYFTGLTGTYPINLDAPYFAAGNFYFYNGVLQSVTLPS